jgi:amino acid transporter
MLIVIQVITQFAAQCVGVMMIRRWRRDIERPFRMPLYPVPALVALAGWIFVLVCSGATYIGTGIAVTGIGVLAYLWRARRLEEWPFARASALPRQGA